MATDRVKLVLDAIKAVKRDAKVALEAGDQVTFVNKMYDLQALEQCLVIETELLVNKVA